MHLEGRVGGLEGSEVNERVHHNRHAAREFHGCGLLSLSLSSPPSSYDYPTFLSTLSFFALNFFLLILRVENRA